MKTLLALMVLTLSACASSPSYEKISKPPEGKSQSEVERDYDYCTAVSSTRTRVNYNVYYSCLEQRGFTMVWEEVR